MTWIETRLRTIEQMQGEIDALKAEQLARAVK